MYRVVEIERGRRPKPIDVPSVTLKDEEGLKTISIIYWGSLRQCREFVKCMGKMGTYSIEEE